MIEKFRRIENLHILFWLVKDACWVYGFEIPGVIMIAPTLAVAVYVTWKLRATVSELVHNLAVTLWICANSIWMIGEFFCDECTKPYAKLFFFAGLIIVGSYYSWRLFQRRHNFSFLNLWREIWRT